MKTPHPYARILRAIADGEEIQFKSDSIWRDQSLETTLQEIADEDYPAYCYRIKPSMITINGHEVPEPLKEPPPEGELVYFPPFGHDGDDNCVARITVGYYPQLLPTLLQQGLLHATEEAAAAHAAALISFTMRD